MASRTFPPLFLFFSLRIIMSALKKIEKDEAESNKQYLVDEKNNQYIRYVDICYIQSHRNVCTFYTKDQELDKLIETKGDEGAALFESYRADNPLGGAYEVEVDDAANIAKSRGGVTLESTIEIKNIVMSEWDFNNPSTMEAWDLASGAYAEQVSGEIRAVIGSELRPGNIWENVELPRLKNNPNVTKITTIDPQNRCRECRF